MSCIKNIFCVEVNKYIYTKVPGIHSKETKSCDQDSLIESNEKGNCDV